MAARSSGTYAEKRRRLTTQSKIPGAGYAPLPTDDEDAIDLPEEHARMPEKLVIHLSAENEVDIPEGPVDHVLQSSTFQALMAGMIMMNALVLGLETDIQDFHYWDLIENLFLLIFAAELGLKFYGQGQKHFFSLGNAEIGWNLFDLVVVGLGVIDFFMSLCFSTSSGSMATLFRIIRLLRIMRLFRIVKFLKQLYLLAFGFVEAIQAMFWVTMLLTVVLYVCSIVMVRTCGRLPHEDPHAEFLHAHFGNIRTSMITLFVLMSSPNLPEYIGQEGLLSERPALLLFLISFIIIGSFGMIALLTGVISESMFEKNQIRAEESRKEQDDLMRKLGTKADEIHDLLDVNEEGEATKEDIAKFAMPLVARLYEEAMVDYTELNLEQLVEVMDTGGDGRINNDEFKRCVTTYAAGVKPLSIQEVHYNTAVCINKIAEINFKLDKVVNSAPPGSPSKADGSIATCSEKLDSIEAQLHQLAERASRSSAGGSGALLDWRLPVCAGGH